MNFLNALSPEYVDGLFTGMLLGMVLLTAMIGTGMALLSWRQRRQHRREAKHHHSLRLYDNPKWIAPTLEPKRPMREPAPQTTPAPVVKPEPSLDFQDTNPRVPHEGP